MHYCNQGANLHRAQKQIFSCLNRLLILLIVSLSPLVLTSCGPTSSRNVQITITVNDNGTLRTGSSVFRFVCQESNPKLGQMGIGKCLVYGEAVAVDLKSRGYLFMTISGHESYNPEDFIFTVMGNRPSATDVSWEIDPEKIKLIRFSSLMYPNTVSEVKPDNLAGPYGYGVKLVGIHAENTTLPFTSGNIEKILPWLSHTESMINGTHSIRGNGLYDRLSRINFISGRRK